MGTIILSSPHGLGTSAIARALSEILDLPVLDRAIPARVARDLAVPIAAALAHDETTRPGSARLHRLPRRLLSIKQRAVSMEAPDRSKWFMGK